MLDMNIIFFIYPPTYGIFVAFFVKNFRLAEEWGKKSISTVLFFHYWSLSKTSKADQGNMWRARWKTSVFKQKQGKIWIRKCISLYCTWVHVTSSSTPFSSLLTVHKTRLEKAVILERDRETVSVAEETKQLRKAVLAHVRQHAQLRLEQK